MTKQKIAIFRNQLFKISEPFITNQAKNYRSFEPIYIGRERLGIPPEASESFALEDIPKWKTFPLKHYQILTRNAYPYAEFLKEKKVAALHAHFGVDGVYALEVKKKIDVPLITTFHGFDATLSFSSLIKSYSPAWINFALLRGKLAKEGDLFVCVSEYIRKRVLMLGFSEEKTRTHYIGIDVNNIEPRTVLDITPTILHVGRLVEKKGTEYLIEAFNQLSKRNKDIQLVIIGDGPLRIKLECQMETLGLRNRIVFLGSQPNDVVHDWMRKSLMVIVPSITASTGDTEGLPTVLLEASALGVPVIGSKHSGIPEAIVDGKTGFLVGERDIVALIERMEYLVDHSDCISEMGNAARVMVKKNFNIAEQTKKLEEIYKEVI